MIYTTNYQGQIPQHLTRQIQPINKQNSLIQAPFTQNSVYHRQQSLQNQGSITFKQQVPELNQQTNLNQNRGLVSHQQAPPSNLVVNNPNQEQNQQGQLEKLTISSNQNQVQTKSVNESIDAQQKQQQQQQQQLQQQQQQSLPSQNINFPQQYSNQVLIQSLNPNQNLQQHQSVYAGQISDQGSPQSNDYRNIYQIHNQPQISTQIQSINRQTALKTQNSAPVYIQNNIVNSNNLNQSISQENMIVHDQQEKLKKSFSSSNHENSENFILNTPQKQNIPINFVNNLVQKDQNIKNNINIQPTAYIQPQYVFQYPNSHQYFVISNQQKIQIMPQQLQNLTDSQYYKNQTQSYQGFIPISNSVPTNNISNNQSVQFQLQINQNHLQSSTKSLNLHKKSFLVDNNDQILQLKIDQQKQSFKDYSPYDKLLNSKIKNKTEGDEYVQNRSMKNNQKITREFDILIQENVITPKKQNLLNSGELSQRSDIIAIDTTDTDIRDRFYSNSKIQTSVEVNQVNNVNKTAEVDNNTQQYSPRSKIQVKEKKYGNEDLCNYYPITHTKVDDLQKYDLVIKCTLKKQNQTAINQIIKEFSEGLQFETQ